MKHHFPLRHVLLFGLVAALTALVSRTFTALQERDGRQSVGLEANLEGVGNDQHNCLPVSHDILQHWKKKVRWGERKFATSAPTSTAETLRQLGLATPADYCYGKLHFDGRTVSLLSAFKEHCNSSTTQRASIGRSNLYLQRFNRLLEERQEASRLLPFSFYIDTTDGTRNNPGLFQQLGVPILTVSRSPNDRDTVPVPDIDMLLGVYTDWDYQALPSAADQALYPAATEYLAPIYQGMGWASPWGEKLPQAVFRGTCHPTIMSNSTNPHSRQPLRAQLCATHGANPDFDIWMTHFEPCSQPSLSGKPMCTQCKACLQGERQLSWEEQSLYRYQLIVDGHGATYNSAVWKLLSGSLVVRLRPDGWDAPIFEQFYDPLFVDVVFHSDVSGLPRVVRECEERMEECQRKGQEARKQMKCLLQSWQLDDYLWGVFLYMHDAVHGRLS